MNGKLWEQIDTVLDAQDDDYDSVPVKLVELIEWKRLAKELERLRAAITEWAEAKAAVATMEPKAWTERIVAAETELERLRALNPEEKKCRWCREGMEAVVIDEDGTLSSISGKPGRTGHAHDDYFWFCEDAIRQAKLDAEGITEQDMHETMPEKL